MKKLIVFSTAAAFAAGLALSAVADAGTTKKKGRSDYTSEQRAKIYAEALRLCRQKSPLVERVEVDYTRMRYTCWIH